VVSAATEDGQPAGSAKRHVPPHAYALDAVHVSAARMVSRFVGARLMLGRLARQGEGLGVRGAVPA
jgi:hypothetical protein